MDQFLKVSLVNRMVGLAVMIQMFDWLKDLPVLEEVDLASYARHLDMSPTEC